MDLEDEEEEEEQEEDMQGDDDDVVSGDLRSQNRIERFALSSKLYMSTKTVRQPQPSEDDGVMLGPHSQFCITASVSAVSY